MTTKAERVAQLRRQHAYAELNDGPRYEIEVAVNDAYGRLQCADVDELERVLADLLAVAMREEDVAEAKQLPVARLVDVWEIWEGERPERLMSEQDYHGFLCLDCHQSTLFGREYYMVTDEVWHAADMTDGMLCIGCLERRIERELVAADFSDANVNTDPEMLRSERLQDRLARTEVEPQPTLVN